VRTTLLALALLLVACSDRDDTSRPSAAGGAATLVQSGPDALVLRIARAGGVVRAYRYPGVDSVVWRSIEDAPSVGRLFDFDPDLGSLVGVTASGAPLRVDLRMGSVSASSTSGVTDAATSDGDNLYVVSGREMARFGAAGKDWSVPVAPASRVFPQLDGSLLIVSPATDGVILRTIRPPLTTIDDSSMVDAQLAVGVAAGDRVYLGHGDRLRAVRARGAESLSEIPVGDSAIAAVATPSGDRVIVAGASENTLSIIDRFEEKVTLRVTLPGEVGALRMDPLGRAVLARMASADSAWVVSLADGSVRGPVATAWREDLPFFGSDDRVALLRRTDVVFASLATLADGARIKGGAADYWFPMRWNGFRPRAKGLDQPVKFRGGTMAGPGEDAQSTTLTRPDSLSPPDDPPDTVQTVARTTTLAANGAAIDGELPPRAPSRYFVVLGSVPALAAARDSARRVSIGGVRGRVLSTPSASGTVNLVVLGPFSSRSTADDTRRQVGPRAWVTEERQ
jgi:cell division septation protein DedD